MNHVSNYEIRTAPSLEELEKKVRTFIKAGWVPTGGVGMHQTENEEMEYFQAMVFPKPTDS